MKRLESRFDVRLHPGEIQPAGFPARLYEIVGNGHDAVVRAEGHNIVALSDGTVEVGKKGAQIPVEPRKNVLDFPAARAEGVSHIIRSEERRVGKECRSRWSTYN